MYVDITNTVNDVIITPADSASVVIDHNLLDIVIEPKIVQVDVLQNAITELVLYQGIQGLSAYQLAVKNGFTGTETQWLASLGGSSIIGENRVVNFTATTGVRYFVDTTNSVISCTLPANATIGQCITFIDVTGSFVFYPLTIVPAVGDAILGSTESLVIDISDTVLSLYWSGSSIGWNVDVGGLLVQYAIIEGLIDELGNVFIDSDGNYLIAG